MRQVSFCFDDGLRRSTETVLRVFEERDLIATFCVLAAPQLNEDPFIPPAAVGDWGFWRDVYARGHEVAPHGYAHERLAALSPQAAIESIDRCLDIFIREMPRVSLDEEIFHAAYLDAPPEVCDHLAGRMLGVRRATGRAGLNDPAALHHGGAIDCMTFGDPAAAKLSARLDRFLTKEQGWLVLVLHGIDGEGFGPVPAEALAQSLDRLLAAGAQVAPAAHSLRLLLPDTARLA